jgi:hypothetical protein
MFLTLEDPRAQIKGSRDPLGVQALWASFGRHVVGNLTTVTSSIRNFTALLGRHAATIEEGRRGEGCALVLSPLGADRRVRPTQVHGVEETFRASSRSEAAEEAQGTIPIRVTSDEIILSDQKTYGLWGLYTVAARVSGLLADGLAGVTAEAQAHLEAGPLAELGKGREAVLDLILDGGDLSTRIADPTVKAVGRMLTPELAKDETVFYGRWLRDGAAIGRGARGALEAGRQGVLARLLVETTAVQEYIGRGSVLALAKAARNEDEGLSHRLERVALLEAFLAPAEALFEHLLARRTLTVDAVAKAIRGHWGPSVPNLNPAASASCPRSAAAGPRPTTIAATCGHRHEASTPRRSGGCAWNGIDGVRGVSVGFKGTSGRALQREVPCRQDDLPTSGGTPLHLDSLRLGISLRWAA